MLFQETWNQWKEVCHISCQENFSCKNLLFARDWFFEALKDSNRSLISVYNFLKIYCRNDMIKFRFSLFYFFKWQQFLHEPFISNSSAPKTVAWRFWKLVKPICQLFYLFCINSKVLFCWCLRSGSLRHN